MKKVNELFNSFKKKPYKLISLLTFLVFIVGISAFSIIKSNQVKGYSGLPYTEATQYGFERYHLMNLVNSDGTGGLGRGLTDDKYIANIEKHQLVDATSTDLKGIAKLEVPYRVASGQVDSLTSDLSISGQYGFLPTWTAGKSRVFLYKKGINSTGADIVELNDGTKATVNAPNSGSTADVTTHWFTAAEVEDGAFMKFTYMGLYKNEWIDVVVKPVSIAAKDNSLLGVGYGKDVSSENVNGGAYLALSGTSGYLDKEGNIGNSTSLGTKYFYMNEDSKIGPNVNYVDVDYQFYKTLVDSSDNGMDMSNQEKTAVQGYFTFGDFDYNESVGLDATQIDQLFVVKPDANDHGKMDINQNPMLYGYTSTNNPSVAANKKTEADVLPDKLKNFKTTDYYKKPDTMGNDDATLFYLVQRYGNYNNAYTQLLYTYNDKSATASISNSYNNDNFIFFNRGYQANTDANVRGNWLSFTYKETSELHLSVNASRAFNIAATSASGTFNIGTFKSDLQAMTTDSDTYIWTKKNEATSSMKTEYKYTYDRNAQDYYIWANIWGKLGITQSIPTTWTKSPLSSVPTGDYSFIAYRSGTSDLAPSFIGVTNSTPYGSTVGYVAKSMVPVLPIPPIKTAEVVADSDTMDVNWEVLQNIPIQFENNKSTTGTMSIQDQVPEYLVVKGGVSGITVKTLGGQILGQDGIPEYFDISYDTTTNLIKLDAKQAYLKGGVGNESFYQNSYIIEYTTSVDTSIYSDQTKLDDFNAKYYKKNGTIENFDGSITNVNNSYVFLNQAKLVSANVYLATYDVYSTPEYSETDIDWSAIENNMPDKYKTPAIVPVKSSITIKKTGEQTDGSQTALAGAGFNVYREADDAQKTKTYVLDSSGNKALFTTGSDGTVKLTDSYEMINSVLTNVGFYNDTYYFEEVNVPAGYEALTTIPSITLSQFGEHTIDIQNNKARTIGDLNVTKQVQYANGTDVGTDLVARGTELFYIVTIQNQSNELTRIDDIVMKDKLPTDFIDVDFTATPLSNTAVENLGTATNDAFTSNIPSTNYTYTSGELAVSGLNVSLGMQQQIRIKIPVKVKSDADAGVFWNTATASGGGINTDGSSASVSKDSNAVSVEVEAFPTGDLKVEKGVSTNNNGTNINDANGAIVNRGDELYYTIVVSNGTSDGTASKIDNIIVSDEFNFLDKISIDSTQIKYTEVESLGTTSTSNYVNTLPSDGYTDGKMTFNSNLSLREGEQFRILIPFKVLATAAPGQFTNTSSAVADGITTAVVSGEVENTVSDYPSGKLALTKEVSDNNTGVTDRNNLDNKEVDRGDTLYYTVTVKNTSSTTSLIDNIVIKDSFDLTKVSVNGNDISISDVEQSSSNPTDPSTISIKPLPNGSSFDATTGVLTVAGLSLREGEQRRILIPVTVREDVSSDVTEITNTASGSPTGTDGVDSIDSNTVTNTLSELDKELYVRQIVVNQNKKVVVPTVGFMEIENVAQTGEKGSGKISNVSVNSGLTADYKKIVIPYSTTNTSYYFDIIVPEMYQIAKGYTVETTDGNVDYMTGKDIDTIFEYSGNGPYYVTVYIEPKIKDSGVIPFYNWSYKDNLFGKIK